ncbi:MAG: NAD(+)/NADH kinase [Chloroflexota bacterium]
MKKAGIFLHSRWPAARELANEVTDYLLAHGAHTVWTTSEWDDESLAQDMPGTEMLFCLGGDGTVLHAARTVIPHEIPILGVNMGRLGFLAEVRPTDLLDYLPRILAGDYRLEMRWMLQADVPAWGQTYHGLNDVVVGRQTIARPIYVEVEVDGSRLAIHRCDAVIVASATGSTAYSLSAGGPILHPESSDLVLTPVSPHIAAARPLVLPPDSLVELTVSADKEAIVSIDGQVDAPLATGDTVAVRRSPHRARFVRFSSPAEYYGLLAERLDWLRVLRSSDHPELFELKGSATAK